MTIRQNTLAFGQIAASEKGALPIWEMLLQLCEDSGRGTLLIDSDNEHRVRVIFDQGFPVAVSGGKPGCNLGAALLGAVSHRNARFTFQPEDQLPSLAGFVTGRLDPYALIATAARDRRWRGQVNATVSMTDSHTLTISPRVNLVRCRFTVDEMEVVQRIAKSPTSVLELAAGWPLRASLLRRVVYVLQQVRALSPSRTSGVARCSDRVGSIRRFRATMPFPANETPTSVGPSVPAVPLAPRSRSPAGAYRLQPLEETRVVQSVSSVAPSMPNTSVPPPNLTRDELRRWHQVVERHRMLDQESARQTLGVVAHADKRALQAAYLHQMEQWSTESLPPHLNGLRPLCSTIVEAVDKAYADLAFVPGASGTVLRGSSRGRS